MADFDYDYLVIGSGFGGSVSALRLAERGYKVGVLEMGKRWHKTDFPKTNWSVWKFLWNPSLGLTGIMQMTILRDVFFLHGAGVGGGSLVYANTLLQPPDEAFADPQWTGGGWKERLEPHYQIARRMLGAVESPVLVETDRLLKQIADELGRGKTFHRHTVGVYFGEPGKEVKDPYFSGEGPDRTGCTMCGGCMVGCRVGAKNTLDQNYLYLAEKRGTEIIPETKVVDVRALEGEGGAADGSGGYEVICESSTNVRKNRRALRARGVVFSAGSYGTSSLLMKSRESGSLPRLSPTLGTYVRTNSEALLAVRSGKPEVDYSKGIAITSGAFVDEKTHVEIVRYPSGSDAMSALTTVLTDGGGKLPRWLRLFGNMLSHPLDAIRTLVPFGWAQKTAILLVMQPVDNHLRYRLKRRWYWPFGKTLDSEIGGGEPAPVYIPIANDVARRMAAKMNGVAQSGLLEVVLGKASTAHILGGCPMGNTSDEGVIDPEGRVFGYQNMHIADGSIIPANLGVNPSLTITAMSEYFMSRVPPKPGAVQRPAPIPPVSERSADLDL